MAIDPLGPGLFSGASKLVLSFSSLRAFANFIHQKDASIACYVISKAYTMGIDVYSVHDCVIAPAAYANQLNKIYTQAFVDLAHPLYLINTLIIHYLFLKVPLEDIYSRYKRVPSNGIFYTRWKKNKERESKDPYGALMEEPYPIDVDILNLCIQRIIFSSTFLLQVLTHARKINWMNLLTL